jgi:hypothetical protein
MNYFSFADGAAWGSPSEAGMKLSRESLDRIFENWPVLLSNKNRAFPFPVFRERG